MEKDLGNIKIDDLFNGVSIPLCIVHDGIVLQCNRHFKEEFCQEDVDPVGKGSAELKIWVNKNDRLEIIEELTVKKHVTNKLVILINAAGARNKYLITLGFLNQNEDYIIGSTINVTGVIDNNQKYQKLHDKYCTLLNTTQTSMVLIDEEFNIKECNKAFLMLIDSQTESIIGADILPLFKCNSFQTVSDLKHRLTEMIKSKEQMFFKNLELQISTLNNDVKWVFINMATYGDNQIVMIINEITEKKIIECKKYIKDEKIKDKLKQNLLSIASSLKRK